MNVDPAKVDELLHMLSDMITRIEKQEDPTGHLHFIKQWFELNATDYITSTQPTSDNYDYYLKRWIYEKYPDWVK